MTLQAAPLDLAELPKAHLHLHLFGSARSATIEELALAQGVDISSIRDFSDLPSFMARFLAVERLIQTPEQLLRICRELVEDEARSGCVYIEPSFVPHDFAVQFNMTPEELLVRMDQAFQEAGERYGVTVRYMISPNRARAPEELAEMARFAVRMQAHGVVAFGYGGDERWGHDRMLESVAIARSGGLKIVPHAGEALGASSVHEAITLMHPDRIAHGVRAVEDPWVLAELAESGIIADVCMTSNWRLGATPAAADASEPNHQLPEMLAAGVRASLNADDEYFFASSILHEYELAREVLHLDDHRLADIARTSIEGSSLPEVIRRRSLDRIDAWEAGALQPVRRLRRPAPPRLELRPERDLG